MNKLYNSLNKQTSRQLIKLLTLQDNAIAIDNKWIKRGDSGVINSSLRLHFKNTKRLVKAIITARIRNKNICSNCKRVNYNSHKVTTCINIPKWLYDRNKGILDSMKLVTGI